MCNKKSAGPRMEPWGTPTLTGYSCDDLASRTNQRRLLLREIELDATARIAPDLLKALAIPSDTTVRKSAVGREDLKPYLKSQKRPYFLTWSTILLFRSLFRKII